jgi:hypothetical protein
LTYALSGDWTNARTIAAQDVPANQLDARLQQWMHLAKPGKASDQVASLVGVTPAGRDQGQPVRLALVKPDTRLAAAAPAPQAAPTPQAPPAPKATPVPVEVAQVPAPSAQPLPVQVAHAGRLAPAPALAAAPMPQFADATLPPAPPPADPQRVAAVQPSAPARVVAASSPSVAPLTMALIAAAAPEAPSAFAAFMPKKAAPAAKPAAKVRKAAAPRPAFRNSGSVVQLGAYRSPQYVNAAWSQLVQRHPALRAYLPMRARFVSPKGIFYRLSITGFANQRDAQNRCQALKNRGGACFVRNFAGDAPVQYASR